MRLARSPATALVLCAALSAAPLSASAAPLADPDERHPASMGMAYKSVIGDETDTRYEQLGQWGNFIWSVISGRCIDVQGTPGDYNGAPLQLWDCEWEDPFTDQRWEITSEGFIRSVISGRCIDVQGTPGDYNGAPLQLWDCEWEDLFTDQRWGLSPDPPML